MRPVKPHITHWHGCDCREARFEAMEAALRELLSIQGDIIPGWNDEFIRRSWVAEIAEKALQSGAVSPIHPPCNPDGSPFPVPPS